MDNVTLNSPTISSINKQDKNLPVNPSSPSKTVKFMLPLAIGIISSLVGFALGYQFHKSTSIPKEVLIKEVQTARDLIFKPQEKWGKTVTEPFIDLRLDGTITKIQEGIIRGGESGLNITLQKESDKATLFVGSNATTNKGEDIRQVVDWKISSTDQLKIGDIVTIRAQAPIGKYVTEPSFRGWWVFHHLKPPQL